MKNVIWKVARGTVVFFVAVTLNVVADAAQTFSLNDDWVNGQAGAAFGQWQLGYHSGSNPNYVLTPFPRAVNPWTIEVVGGWDTPGYDNDFPIPGMGKVNANSANHLNKDMPEGSIVIYEKGGAYFTVPTDSSQAVVAVDMWQPRSSFGTPFIFRGTSYTDLDAQAPVHHGTETSSDPGRYEIAFENVTAGEILGVAFGGADYHGANVSVTLDSEATIGSFIWAADGIGNWATSGNWNPRQVPNDPEHEVIFSTGITGPTTVVTNFPLTVNRMEFDNAIHSFAVGGLGHVNLAMGANAPRIDVVTGNHEFQAGVFLRNDTTVDVSTGAMLTFNNSLNLMGKTLTKSGEGMLAVRNDLVLAGGTFNVQEGTVSGNGTMGGDVNQVGGIISPGNSNVSLSTVPEPATVALLYLSGLLFLLCRPLGVRR